MSATVFLKTGRHVSVKTSLCFVNFGSEHIPCKAVGYPVRCSARSLAVANVDHDVDGDGGVLPRHRTNAGCCEDGGLVSAVHTALPLLQLCETTLTKPLRY